MELTLLKIHILIFFGKYLISLVFYAKLYILFDENKGGLT